MSNPNLIFQVRVEDHLSPMLKAFNDAFPHGGDVGPIPEDATHVECRPFRSGGTVSIMPSASLLLWMARVMACHQQAQRGRVAARNEEAEHADASA